MQAVLDRAQHLRATGRNAEALALLQPFTPRRARDGRRGEQGMWLINEAAYSLSALGRDADAMRLMERIAALPVADNISLVSAFINRNDILFAAGRYADALAWGQRLDRDYSRFASDYGKMWIAAGLVCAYAGLNRSAEAAPQLERLRTTGTTANPAALTLAYLCVGDSDAAAAVLVHRLESEDPESAILALQDYNIAERADSMKPVVDRLIALRRAPRGARRARPRRPGPAAAARALLRERVLACACRCGWLQLCWSPLSCFRPARVPPSRPACRRLSRPRRRRSPAPPRSPRPVSARKPRR